MNKDFVYKQTQFVFYSQYTQFCFHCHIIHLSHFVYFHSLQEEQVKLENPNCKKDHYKYIIQFPYYKIFLLKDYTYKNITPFVLVKVVMLNFEKNMD